MCVYVCVIFLTDDKSELAAKFLEMKSAKTNLSDERNVAIQQLAVASSPEVEVQAGSRFGSSTLRWRPVCPPVPIGVSSAYVVSTLLRVYRRRTELNWTQVLDEFSIHVFQCESSQWTNSTQLHCSSINSIQFSSVQFVCCETRSPTFWCTTPKSVVISWLRHTKKSLVSNTKFGKSKIKSRLKAHLFSSVFAS